MSFPGYKLKRPACLICQSQDIAGGFGLGHMWLWYCDDHQGEVTTMGEAYLANRTAGGSSIMEMRTDGTIVKEY